MQLTPRQTCSLFPSPLFAPVYQYIFRTPVQQFGYNKDMLGDNGLPGYKLDDEIK